MSYRIAVLMTCFNRKSTTLRCLESLFAQVMPDDALLSVYLLDDNSPDSTGSAVRHAFPQVTVLHGDGKSFWNGGMRTAFAAALADGYDFYVWLNDDTVLDNDALLRVLDTFHVVSADKTNRVIVVGATRGIASSELTYGGYQRVNRLNRIRIRRLEVNSEPHPCDTMNGNFILIPQAVAAQLGNLDSRFTHAMGDLDYGFRAAKAGIKLWVAPGYVGTCERNTDARTWRDPALSFSQRWHAMMGPKGLPPKEWCYYCARHAGPFWPLFFVSPYLRLLASSLVERKQ